VNDDHIGASTPEPDPQLVISSLETLRVFADPLRQQILDCVRDEARTVKQIAAILKRQPTKLYYHINLLEEHKLIRVTDTRIVSGIIEKHYRAAARRFEIRRALLLPGADGEDADRLDAALDAILNPIRDEIHRAVGQQIIDNHEDAPLHRKLLLRRAFARLTDEQAAEFYARLEALIAEFEAADSAGAETHAHRLLFGYFPMQE
jgi:DNA-binding transcriptional ArsR family regulator